MEMIEPPITPGRRTALVAGVLFLDIVLAVAGLAMLFSYMDERKHAAAQRAPVAALPLRDARPDGAPAQAPTARGARAAGQSPTAEVMAQLTQQVGMVVKRQNEQLQRCYTQASRHAPSSEPVTGHLNIRFEITPAGRTRSVRVDTNTSGSSELAQCVVAHFESWTFPPPPGNEPVELAWPIRFKAPK